MLLKRVMLSAIVASGIGCQSAPTSIFLVIEAQPNLSVERVLLSIIDDSGVVVRSRRLPPSGNVTLPSDVVLFPNRTSVTVRILGQGTASGSIVGDGVVRVVVKTGQQVEARLTITAERDPDRDGDGVPDAIDNCPDEKNADQLRCQGPPADGGADGAPLDAGPDLAEDATIVADLPAAQGPDLKVDCYGDSDCDDQNSCTVDRCSGGKCSNAHTNEGKTCTDAGKCITGAATCIAGKCSGKATTCPGGNDCEVATCKPTTGCGLAPKKDGTTCADADPCTTGESCKAGKCSTPTQPSQCRISGTCYADGYKRGTCRTCSVSRTKTSWTIITGYCYVDSTCHKEGVTNPARSCQVCRASSNAKGWSLKSGFCLISSSCHLSAATDGPCRTCDPGASTSSWTMPTSGCTPIEIVALNNGHNGDLGGLRGANTLCQTQATAAGRSGTFKAFLSSSSQNVKSLITGSVATNIPVVNRNRQLLYASWNDIFGGKKRNSGTNYYAFDGKKVDEATGASPEWTDADGWHGSTAAGAVNGSLTCSDWTATTGSGRGGELDQISSGLDLLAPGETHPCTYTAAVLCVRSP